MSSLILASMPAVGISTTDSDYLTAVDAEKARREAAMRSVLDARFPGAPVVELPMKAWCWRTRRVPGHRDDDPAMGNRP